MKIIDVEILTGNQAFGERWYKQLMVHLDMKWQPMANLNHSCVHVANLCSCTLTLLVDDTSVFHQYLLIYFN